MNGKEGYDVTSEEEYIYEDYILAMQIIIVSEEEVTGTDNDIYYNIVETPFEHATMNLKLQAHQQLLHQTGNRLPTPRTV